MRQPVIYGAVVFAAIFFVGWITGMGGSFWPNLAFSLLMGVLGAALGASRRRLSRLGGLWLRGGRLGGGNPAEQVGIDVGCH